MIHPAITFHISSLLALFFQVAASSPAGSGAAPAIPDSFTSVITLNAIAVWIIEAFKKSKYFSFITAQTQTANKVASLLAASVGAAGITFVYANPAPGTFNLTVQGLTLAAVGHWGWHVISNYAIQKGWYKLAFATPNTLQQMVEIQQQQNQAAPPVTGSAGKGA